MGFGIKDRPTPSVKNAKKREECMWKTGAGLEHPGRSHAELRAGASGGVGPEHPGRDKETRFGPLDESIRGDADHSPRMDRAGQKEQEKRRAAVNS